MSNDYYVNVNADDKSGSGTRGDPFTTIQEALAVAQSDDFIYVAEGTYAEAGPFSLSDGIQMFGSYTVDGLQWRRDTFNAPSIIQDTQTGADCITISSSAALQSTRFDGFHVEAPDCTSSSIAMNIEDFEGLIVRNTIYTGSNAGAHNVGIKTNNLSAPVVGLNQIYAAGGIVCYGIHVGGDTSGIFLGNGIYSWNEGTNDGVGVYVETSGTPIFMLNTIGAEPSVDTASVVPVATGGTTSASIWQNNLFYIVTLPVVKADFSCIQETNGTSNLGTLDNNLFVDCSILYKDGVNGDLTTIADVNDASIIGATTSVNNFLPAGGHTLADILVGNGAGDFDFHLVAGSDAIDSGFGNLADPVWDIDGDPRQSPLDVGCDKF
jgi:hypothetical protein